MDWEVDFGADEFEDAETVRNDFDDSEFQNA